MFTPYVTITARQLLLEVDFRVHGLSVDIERTCNPGYDPEFHAQLDTQCRTELVIIDEADRPKTSELEQLRDLFDDHDLGMILIGMRASTGNSPGTRSCTAVSGSPTSTHQYRPLDPEDIPAVLAHYWQQLGLPFDPPAPTTPMQPAPSPASPAGTSASSNGS